MLRGDEINRPRHSTTSVVSFLRNNLPENASASQQPRTNSTVVSRSTVNLPHLYRSNPQQIPAESLELREALPPDYDFTSPTFAVTTGYVDDRWKAVIQKFGGNGIVTAHQPSKLLLLDPKDSPVLSTGTIPFPDHSKIRKLRATTDPLTVFQTKRTRQPRSAVIRGVNEKGLPYVEFKRRAHRSVRAGIELEAEAQGPLTFVAELGEKTARGNDDKTIGTGEEPSAAQAQDRIESWLSEVRRYTQGKGPINMTEMSAMSRR